MSTTNLALNQPAYNSSAWDVPLNANETILDNQFAGTTSIALTNANVTLTSPNTSGTGQTQAMRIVLTGALSANVQVIIPSGISGRWIVYNTTSGSYTVTIASGGGGATVAAPQNYNVSVYSDGTNIRPVNDAPNTTITPVVYGGTGLATLTANNVILGNGTSTPTFVAPSTLGNVLTSNGTTWVSQAPTSSGRFLRAPRVLTSTAGGTYTTPAGCNYVLIEMIGAGGGGGGCSGSGPTSGGGGGCGVYASVYVAVSPSTGYTYAVGAGGTASTGSAGGAGGTTSITISSTTYSCSGGAGGGYNNGTPGSTGTSSNMDYSLTPLNAASGLSGGCTLTPYGENMGGGTFYSGTSPYSGPRGLGFGAGGGGAYNGGSYGFNFSGGVGIQGVIRIWEYS